MKQSGSMDQNDITLFDSVAINGMVLKNRLVMAPVYMGNKCLNEPMSDYYVKRAAGGVGLIIVPLPPPEDGSGYHGMSFRERSFRFIEKCHVHGCKVIPQIFPGEGEKVNTLPTDKILEIPQRLGETAARIRDAGYDGIEIHGAHHSLFMHLISPLLNFRKDRFGLAAGNSMEIQTATVVKVREVTGPDFPVFFRFSATEFSSGGVDLSITIPFSGMLEKAGVDCLDISAGGTGASPPYSDCPDESHGEACFSFFSKSIKAQIGIPLIVSGRITSMKSANSVLSGKCADLIGVGRSLMADPEWPEKIRTGREDTLVPETEWYALYKRDMKQINQG